MRRGLFLQNNCENDSFFHLFPNSTKNKGIMCESTLVFLDQKRL